MSNQQRMNLFPQHLRDRQHAEIIRRRSYGLRGKGEAQGYNVSAVALPEPKIGFLGRLWARGSGLTEKQAATGLPAASMSTGSAVWLPPTLVGSLGFIFTGIYAIKHGFMPEPMLGVMAATALLSYLSSVPWGKAAFQWLYKQPLAEGEIEHLLENDFAASEVEKDYLRLVRDAVRQTADISKESEAEIQEAITALGEAIDRLPTITVTSLDTAALRREAEALRNESRNTSDQVISESLERRADAIVRRADANDRSAVAVRRTTALRAEIEAQIAALREGIASLASGYGGSDAATVANLTQLSESARRVATEAVSAAAARNELDATATPQYTTTAVTPAPETIRVGMR